MERFIRFYGLQIKSWLKKKICWMQLLAMVILTQMILQIQLPDQENIMVGIEKGESQMAGKVTELLQYQDSIYEFCFYEDDTLLRKDVETGKLECGFVFDTDFDKKYEKRNFENSILYLATPFTTKGLAAQETVYAAFLQVYGSDLLLDEQEAIFGKEDPEIAAMLTESYDYYLKSEEIFHTRTIFVDDEQRLREKDNTDPLHGLMGILIFMTIFLAGMGMTGASDRNLLSAMEVQSRTLFQCTRMLAAATPVGVLGIVIACSSFGSRGLLAEIVHMILLVALSMIEVLLLFRLQKHEEMGKASLLALVMLQAVVCPVFFDMSAYVPVLSMIRYFLPLGYYL